MGLLRPFDGLKQPANYRIRRPFPNVTSMFPLRPRMHFLASRRAALHD